MLQKCGHAKTLQVHLFILFCFASQRLKPWEIMRRAMMRVRHALKLKPPNASDETKRDRVGYSPTYRLDPSFAPNPATKRRVLSLSPQGSGFKHWERLKAHRVCMYVCMYVCMCVCIVCVCMCVCVCVCNSRRRG